MLWCHGVAPDRARAELPDVVEDVEAVCRTCHVVARCHVFLAGTSRDAPRLFCPNAMVCAGIARVLGAGAGRTTTAPLAPVVPPTVLNEPALPA